MPQVSQALMNQRPIMIPFDQASLDLALHGIGHVETTTKPVIWVSLFVQGLQLELPDEINSYDFEIVQMKIAGCGDLLSAHHPEPYAGRGLNATFGIGSPPFRYWLKNGPLMRDPNHAFLTLKVHRPLPVPIKAWAICLPARDDAFGPGLSQV